MNKVKTVPALRFKEFEGEWGEKVFKDFLTPEFREIPRPLENYLAIGIKSHFKGTFQKPDSDPNKIEMDKLFKVQENDLIVNITFAWEGAIAIVKKEDEGGLVSHRFPTYEFDENSVLCNYFKYVFPREKFKAQLDLLSPGGAGRNRVLSKKDFLKIKWLFPSIKEQQKIATFLTAVDKKLELLKQKKEAMEKYKKGVMQKIFNQETRFKDENGEDFEDWEEKRLGDYNNLESGDGDWILSKDIDSNGKYQIIQLGNIGLGKFIRKKYKKISESTFNDLKCSLIKKGDLLINRMIDGKLYTCIFDFDNNFITSVDVCWIRKNHHFNNYFLMNLLLVQKNQNKLVNLSSGSGRVRISKKNLFNQFSFLIPSLPEQKKIASFLSNLDLKIESLEKEIVLAEKWKEGLLQGMFV